MEEDIIIYETKLWKVILFPDQSYLGRCIVNLKRNCGILSKLTSEEWREFENIVEKLESALKKAFNATMFNWSCLMNSAYKEKNPKPHIHWHFKPRYKDSVNFADILFQDLEFGHHYNDERKVIVSKSILEKIAKEIKNYL